MADDENESRFTFVDDFKVNDVAAALRTMAWTEKMTAIVKALTSAPNRALSRFEMARAIGSESVNSTNSTLGRFAKRLALELEPNLESVWKPAGGRGGGDWVAFACYGGARVSSPLNGEPDDWVFVMRETLARALAQNGIAAYKTISADVAEMWEDRSEVGWEDDADEEPSDNPLGEIQLADESGEFKDLSETEREAVVTARIGQGRFRDELLERWECQCAVTGATLQAALVASHIKPWSLCSNSERVDPANGLPLVGTLDRLFDYGLISFDVGGKIMISPRVRPRDRETLHLRSDLRLRMVPAETAHYLAFHRAECFWDSLDEDVADS